MKITCISASNTKLGNESISTKVCQLIKEIISVENDYTFSILPLSDFNFNNCILCGNCFEESKCIFDEDFNKVFSELATSDAIFFVIPHYSPIPSKLLMIFEKINEILYATWLNDPTATSPLTQKIVGIIGHGGMTESEKVLTYYHDNLVTTIANTLRSLSFKVIPHSEKFPNGAVFGLKNDECLQKQENQLFPVVIADYELIEERINPLITNVLNHLQP